MDTKVYLDFNSTTPILPDMKDHVISKLSAFGNPSSVHWAGREAKKEITWTRNLISQNFNCHPLEIIFTASGSEGNNLALQHFSPTAEKNEIVCSMVEHPSILKPVKFLESKGFKVRWIPVAKDGLLDLEYFKTLLSTKTALVVCQLVNNETGNIFPIKKMTKLAHSVGAHFHSDMVQGLGKLRIDLAAMDVDTASFAGHKFYSLKGAGFLYVKRGVKVPSLILGGGQERGRRAGTENVLAISSLGYALSQYMPHFETKRDELTQMRDWLENKILEEIPGASVNGAGAPRVAGTLNVTLAGVDGETLLINLDTSGFAISSGAACSSGTQEPSPVLRAMGLDFEEASQSFRISLGWPTTLSEVESFFTTLKESVVHVRSLSTELTQVDQGVQF